jgi:MoaA/NifB/PqqE/SkfB family radical SAM enzyme
MIEPKRLAGYLKKFRITGKPFLAFQIEPTSRCQLKCVMCPRTVFSDEWVNGDMPLPAYTNISRYFHLVKYVHLQGWGEPLLHPELPAMVAIAKAEHCKVSLTTNGILLTQNMSEELIRKGLDTIVISIAGAVRVTHEDIRRGSHFEQIIDNVKALANLKLETRSKTPMIVLSFLMTKTNISELPDAVGLAKDMGGNEFLAANLDYTPTQAMDDLKVFSSDMADSLYGTHIDAARIRARGIKLSFREYPLRMEEMIMCEMNPLRIIFITFDGCVSPCVYLNLPKKGPISRIFCGARYLMQRVYFGSIAENDFMEIWNNEAYRDFRGFYARRMAVNREAFDYIDAFPSKDDMTALFEKQESNLRENPLPAVCQTCYKAYGI